MMEHLLIRPTHEFVQALHTQAQPAMMDNTHVLLYYLISFLVLAIIAFFSLKSYACEKFAIPVLLYKDEMFYLNLTMVLIMGGVGLSAVIDKTWHQTLWLYYAISNLLIAAYILFYHRGFGYALFFSTVFLGGLSYFLYQFFGMLNSNDTGVIVMTLIGIVLAWALVWFVVVLGQVIVYDVGIEKRPQTYCFFLTVLVVLFVGIFWLRKLGVGWLHLIGYLFSGSAHVGFMLVRSMTHSFW